MNRAYYFKIGPVKSPFAGSNVRRAGSPESCKLSESESRARYPPVSVSVDVELSGTRRRVRGPDLDQVWGLIRSEWSVPLQSRLDRGATLIADEFGCPVVQALSQTPVWVDTTTG